MSAHRSSAQRSSSLLLWLTVAAAPVALGFETVLRLLIFPPEFEEVREFLQPMLTPVAWGFAGLAGLTGLLGLALQRRLADKKLARLPATADADQRYREVFGVFLLTTALPQIPAILSSFAYMFGASIVPVVVGIGVCSVGVVGQALRLGSLADRPGSPAAQTTLP